MVGRIEPHHADGLTREREFERANVQVRALLGREQREASPAAHDAGEVVRDVVVGLHRHATAEPQPRQDALGQRERVLLREAG